MYLLNSHFSPPLTCNQTSNQSESKRWSQCNSLHDRTTSEEEEKEHTYIIFFFLSKKLYAMSAHRLWPLPCFLSKSHSYDTSQPSEDARHAMQIVNATGVLDAQVGCQDGLHRRKKGKMRKTNHTIYCHNYNYIYIIIYYTQKRLETFQSIISHL